MTGLFYLSAFVLVLLLATLAFVRMDAHRVAGALRVSGPFLVGAAGLVLLLLGRAGIGTVLLTLATGWYARGRGRRSTRKSPGGRSHVRTAALEMELDHDTGGLQGMVLAGRYEGRELDALDERELLDLVSELAGDSESRQLLETYLDSRFPVWRDNAQADMGARHEGPAAPGPMTKQEAYQVLGLEAGASPADIRKAHRRLMQRLHPDVGGSSFLAARINEAKDILLSNHE